MRSGRVRGLLGGLTSWKRQLVLAGQARLRAVRVVIWANDGNLIGKNVALLSSSAGPHEVGLPPKTVVF